MLKKHPHAAPIVAAMAFVVSAQAESHLMRFADVHDDQVVFTYEDDLWRASTSGGSASRLTNDPGSETWAKFSPDGKWIAFTGQYDGGNDVYVMDAAGGVPRRLTYHPANDRVLGWWPDGKSILFRSSRDYPSRGEEVYRVPLAGGPPEKLPVDRAGLATVSPDGKMLAYNRITREHHTWKRHQGGTAQQIWMGSFEKQDYHVVTDWMGTNNFPMWYGEAIYFSSDREHGTLNLYKYDTKTGSTTALTSYKDYDVKYPSLGTGQIIYQYAESLHVLDVKTGQTRRLPIEIPSDLVRMRPEPVGIAPTTGSFGLSPTGVRVLLEARGEILNLPTKDGEPINLTRTSGSREKSAAWSPDGRWIAFLSDKTGEEEVYLVDQKAELEWRQVTHGGLGFRMQLVWSPDSKHLLFSDKFLGLNLVDAESGDITVLDKSDYDDCWERWGIQDYVWSPDSKWVAYTKMEQSMNDSIFLYSLGDKKSCRLTSDQTEDWSPSFDPDGRYLYFLSNRTFRPQMGGIDQNNIFLDMTRPYVVLLKADAASPFAPQDSAEEAKPAAAGEEPAKKSAEEPKQPTDTPIDIDGLARRIVVAENVPAGNYFRLEATKGGFVYLKKPEREFTKYQVAADHTGGSLDLYSYDLEKKETAKVLGGIANYHVSADGKKLVYRAGSTYGVVDAGKVANVGDGKIELGRVRIDVDRTQEFMQIFNEAWRIERDWFYDANLHGVNWAAIGEQYRRFVPFCGERSDLNYLIGEMIGELNAGHTYVGGGDNPSAARHVATGMLGADFEVVAGANYYRIRHILPGTPGDPDERSPLDEPGCPIKVGHYIIAIDGQPVTTSDEIYKGLQGKADTVVTLTYSDQPAREGAKTYRVRTIGGEEPLRYREWVENNRAYVAQRTDGQVGYVHIPDMDQGGLIEFAKVWYPQFFRKGFIIDVRYNGGGFTADMIIDRLERRVWSMTQPREGKPAPNPERVFTGPWCVVVNEDTASNGEFFAEAIKIKKLAPVFGMRTWGGSVGIESHQDLLDGGGVTAPQFGLYSLDGRWLIEGVGVVPDIEVQNMPGDVLQGKDAQLDAAIDYVQKELKAKPNELPAPPPYPNKSRPAGSQVGTALPK